MATAPISDFGFVLTPDLEAGGTAVELDTTPAADVRLVAGPARLQQMVRWWLLMDEGQNPFAPTDGNPMLGLLLRPSTDPGALYGMIDQCEANFLLRQRADAAGGYLAADELVDHFETPAVVATGLYSARLDFVVVSAAGSATSLSASVGPEPSVP